MVSVVEVTPRQIYAQFGRTLIIRPAEDEDTEAFFDEMCACFENDRIEQAADGSVYVIAPTGGESSYHNSELTMQLHSWAKQDGRGRAFDSNGLFVLTDRSRLAPDASWISNEKLATLSARQRQTFLRLVPEFIVELTSPSDRLSELQSKMENWMRNGVELGWLIDPEKRWFFVSRQGAAEAEKVEGLSVSGEGPMNGFEFDLTPIWDGLTI